MTVLLADLSNNNREPDWQRLRAAGVVGVWLKVSEGTGFVDETWPERSRAARQAGLRVGGYHFARTNESFTLQTQLFTRALGKVQRRDLRPVLDLETNDGRLSSQALHGFAHGFLRVVRKRTGVGGLFYSYGSFIRQQSWLETVGYGLWLADYGPDDGGEHVPRVPLPWRRCVAHQFTSKGSAGGLHPVDLSSARRLRPLLAHPLQSLL